MYFRKSLWKLYNIVCVKSLSLLCSSYDMLKKKKKIFPNFFKNSPYLHLNIFIAYRNCSKICRLVFGVICHLPPGKFWKLIPHLSLIVLLSQTDCAPPYNLPPCFVLYLCFCSLLLRTVLLTALICLLSNSVNDPFL